MRWIGLIGLVSGCAWISDGAVEDKIAEICAANPDLEGCPPVSGVECFTDADGDGFGAGTAEIHASCPSGTVEDDSDCDDSAAGVNPGAEEICGNAVDEDCDGSAPDGVDAFVDGDGDGYGGEATVVCALGTGVAEVGGDCDDSSAAANPGATEVCGNDVDEDCDGSAQAGVTVYTDADGDGYGDGAGYVVCEAGANESELDGDCDDTDDLVSPGVPEDCSNTIDDDCDGSAPAEVLAFVDGDMDGYGGTQSAMVCEDLVGFGYSFADGDCDDTTDTRSPGVPEDCDTALDENCDGEGGYIFAYFDVDQDGVGNAATEMPACNLASNQVSVAGDCDDMDATRFPGNPEIPGDGIDNDCDDRERCYEDLDGDGFGTAVTLDTALGVHACLATGEANVSTDCDDDCSTCFPLGVEVCDDRDNDCNDSIDDNATDAPTWYVDADDDGYGDELDAGVAACEPPVGTYVTNATDCDDAANGVNPGAVEICLNGIDENCDEDDTGSVYWFDQDSDGFGDPTTQTNFCGTPDPGYVPFGGDCDDDQPLAFPGNTARVAGDGIDNDCLNGEECFHDGDADGFAPNNSPLEDAIGGTSCEAVNLQAGVAGDCDDVLASRNPDADEVPGNVVDENCNSLVACYPDNDGDGYGGVGSAWTEVPTCNTVGRATFDNDCNDTDFNVKPGVSEVYGNPVDENCDGDWGCYVDSDGDNHAGSTQEILQAACTVGQPTDCDDNDNTIYPGAPELCDLKINACGGTLPLNESDIDGDGYVACSGTYITTDGDCDDNDPLARPGLTEVVADAFDRDEDCNGRYTCYNDADGDHHGPTSGNTKQVQNSVADCEAGGGAYVADDCDDAEADRFPGNPEVCDGLDNNCDNALPPNETDDDNDTYVECTSIVTGFNGGDCDDTRGYSYPGATERCDGRDNDCDGVITDDIGLVTRVNGASAINYTGQNALQSALNGTGDQDVVHACPRTTSGTAWPVGNPSYNGRVNITGHDVSGARARIGRSSTNTPIMVLDNGLTLTNVVIDGGAVSSTARCIDVVDGSVEIYDSTLQGCISSAGYGGALQVGSASSLYMENVVVQGNSATLGGGGVACNNCEDVTIYTSTFTDNTSVAPLGGATGLFIWDVQGSAYIEGSDFIANSGGASAIVLDNSPTSFEDVTIVNNHGDSFSGGLTLFSSTVVMNNSQVSSNTSSSSSYGAGIHITGTSRLDMGYSTVSNHQHFYGAIQVDGSPPAGYSHSLDIDSTNLVTGNRYGVVMRPTGTFVGHTAPFLATPNNTNDIWLYQPDTTLVFIEGVVPGPGFQCNGTSCQ
ncbi:MAG: putative metal-binding motif-containing protein [Alphaproteobacteria bacterium]|nr:putative metal-binding motif-containing protein [Alphaproteobacteria bacterium]